MKEAVLMLLASAAALSLSALYAADSVQFPDRFRRWAHVGTGVIMPGANPQLMSEEGMHHIFANQKAGDTGYRLICANNDGCQGRRTARWVGKSFGELLGADTRRKDR